MQPPPTLPESAERATDLMTTRSRRMFVEPYGAYAEPASEDDPGFFEVVREARRMQGTTCKRGQAKTRGMIAAVLNAYFATVKGLKEERHS